MKQTLPSRSIPYEIYLKDHGECILSVNWLNGNYSYYLLDDKGTIISTDQIKYIPMENEKEEIYFEDYLSADTIRKILVLTTVFSSETIVLAFEHYSKYFLCDDVNYCDFDMPHAYMFSDYVDLLRQMYSLTEEEQYLQKINESEYFFSRYFHDFTGTNWSFDDKVTIKSFFQNSINFLNKNKEQ